MITMIQPLTAGNALRLFIQPPTGAVRWKVLRNGNGVFTGHDDASSIVAYDGADKVTLDTAFLQNEVMAFYKPFYTFDGATWTPGAVASATPRGTYEDFSTDVMSQLRDRLEAGLLIEVQRGNLVNPRFWRMLADVMRFNALCTRIAKEQREKELQQPLSEFFENAQIQRAVSRLVFFAHAGLYLELPDLANAAISCGHHGEVLRQPRPVASQQPPAMVHGARRCQTLCASHHSAY